VNRSLLLFGGLITLLFGAGLVTRSSGVLALILPFLVYIALALYHAPEEVKVRVERSLSSERSSFGRPVEIRVIIENLGGPLEEVLLTDLATRPLSLEKGSNRLLGSLPTGGRLEWEYTLAGERGEYRFKGLQISAADGLGIFRLEAMADVKGVVTVFPPVPRLRPVPIRPPNTRGFAGPINARMGGSGIDFFGVRQYQPGDPPRRINWRVSAFHNEELFTNEFEQERLADVGLILDARSQGYVRAGERELFDYAVQAASALAKVFLDDGNRVSLLVYGAGIERVYPGYGKVQLDRILRKLARAQTGLNYALETLHYLPVRLIPPGSQIVMVSPLQPDDLTAFRRIRSHGYEILLVSPNPVEFEYRLADSEPWLDQARRLAQVERAILLNGLKKSGVRVVDWDVETNLDSAIQQSAGVLRMGRRRLAAFR
jgi:uncharacterized protein (DUF58 family)